jgi:hypothetical protein
MNDDGDTIIVYGGAKPGDFCRDVVARSMARLPELLRDVPKSSLYLRWVDQKFVTPQLQLGRAGLSYTISFSRQPLPGRREDKFATQAEEKWLSH